MTQQLGHANGVAGAMVHAPLVKAVPADATQAFEPRNIDQAIQLAGLLVSSRLLPRSVQTPEAAFAIIATGRELGLTAMQSLRSIHVIEGKPTLSADLILALVKSRRDVCAWFMLVESTDQVAHYRTQRIGEPEPTNMSFTIDDAQRAGVTGKDNWRKYPAAMLRARCIAALSRAVYPDLTLGIYESDELEPAPPVQVPEGQRYTAQPAPIAKVPLDAVLFEALANRADQAETPAALNDVAKDAGKAHKSGAIDDVQFGLLKSVVLQKRANFDVPAPTSEPKLTEEVPQ